MPIDVERALAAELPEHRTPWGADDVILYHLALGAGELEYAYEGRLKVLPTYGVIPATPILTGLRGLPGLDFPWTSLLHGEQDLEVLCDPPAEADGRTTARIAAIYDKGSGALVVVEAMTTDAGGAALFVNRSSLFIRGEGGFGGEPGPSPDSDAPARSPDVAIERATVPHQALLYRLCGDKNLVHADPAVAERAGFERPILHGLCTYGIACKAAVDNVLGGDVTAVARYQVRFTGVVFPGETVLTSMWREADGRIVLSATTKERGQPVLSNAAIWTR
jgi:acyl dehydratase